ncbi:MAG: choice-of-anchor D domain-containing protein [Acidobacteriota bacterium]
MKRRLLLLALLLVAALPASGQIQFEMESTVVPNGTLHDFGSGPEGVDRTWRVTLRNVGVTTIDVTQVSILSNNLDPGRFTAGNFDLGVFPPGDTGGFDLTFESTDTGTVTNEISLVVGGIRAYEFDARATAATPIGPVIELRQNGAVVPQGSTFDFGDTGVGQALERTFTVTNVGDLPLSVAPIALVRHANDPARFSVTDNQVSNVAPGASATFRLHFDAAALGSVTSEVELFVGGIARYEFFVTAETRTSDFGLSLGPPVRTILPGQNAFYTATITGQFGFTGTVTFSISGLPAATTARFTPSTVQGSGTTELKLDTSTNTPLSDSTFTVTATSGGVSRSATSRLVVTSGADFSLAASPGSRSVERGQTTLYTVQVEPSNGFSDDVTLSLAGLPAGATARFTPRTLQPGDTSTLEVFTSASTPLGTRTLTVSGRSGGRTRTTMVGLEVTEEPVQGAAPVILGLEPESIVHGETHIITLTGSNFHGTTLSIPSDSPDPSQPMNRVFPTATIESINQAGTEMRVLVDATDTRILDFYNLLLSNDAGEAGKPFRVLPVGPLVDAWTPAEPMLGNAYVLSIVGRNLRHATVSPSLSGRVRIFSVDNGRQDRLNALMEVLPGAALGPLDLVVRDPAGRTISLPIEVTAQGATTLLTRNLLVEQGITTPRSGGSPQPALYFQDFSMRHTELTVASADDVVVLHPDLSPSEDRVLVAPEGDNRMIFPGIICSIPIDLAEFHWQVAVVFDPDTGRIGDTVLQGLNLGDRVNIGSFVLSFFLDIDLVIRFRCDFRGWSFPIFCLRITSALEIPGRAGFAFQIDFCSGGGGDEFTSGSTDTTTIVGGPCAEVTQQGPPSEGLTFAQVEQNDCCEQPIGVAASGTSFTGSQYFIPFNISTPNAGTTTPGEGCGMEPCMVTFDQPRACIVNSKIQSFKAEGMPANGNYSWQVVQGGNRVAIEGPTDTDSVRLRGNAVSQSADDIELEVEYTDPTGTTCRSSIDLSVVDVDLNWRGSGRTDPMNAALNTTATHFGMPNLGPVAFTTHPGTIGWFKNMEIKARVTPCDPNLRCEFDIRRTRQGVIGTIRNDSFVPLRGHCPQGNCSDDIDHNDGTVDEDLVLDGPPGCGLFSIDTPGFGTEPCAGAGGPYTLLNCLNFDEWLRVDGQIAGGIQKWSASTRTFCNGQYWTESSEGTGNQLVQNSPLACVVPSSPGIAESPFNLSEALSQLVSSNWTIRHSGAATIYAALASGKITASDRQDLLNQLRIIASNPHYRGQQPFSRPLLAINLLGELQDESSIPLLIGRLEEEFRLFGLIEEDELTAAAAALIKIGPAVIEPILDRAQTASASEWELCEAVLAGMEDPADVEEAVERRILGATVAEMDRFVPLMN